MAGTGRSFVHVLEYGDDVMKYSYAENLSASVAAFPKKE